MKVCLFGAAGKVGSALGPALAATGHEVEIRGLCAECRWARRAPKQ